jgi:hypothetical protein
MLEKKLEYRMYGFAPYQLTGIQMGIQNGHSKRPCRNEVCKEI